MAIQTNKRSIQACKDLVVYMDFEFSSIHTRFKTIGTFVANIYEADTAPPPKDSNQVFHCCGEGNEAWQATLTLINILLGKTGISSVGRTMEEWVFQTEIDAGLPHPVYFKVRNKGINKDIMFKELRLSIRTDKTGRPFMVQAQSNENGIIYTPFNARRQEMTL